jgi:hypothetical protein
MKYGQECFKKSYATYCRSIFHFIHIEALETSASLMIPLAMELLFVLNFTFIVGRNIP